MPLKIQTHWQQRRHCGSKRHITSGFHQLKMKRTRTTANTINEALEHRSEDHREDAISTYISYGKARGFEEIEAS